MPSNPRLAGGMQRLAIVCNESAGRVDAIRDYSVRLAGAIRHRGVAADLCLRQATGRWFVMDGENRGLPRESLHSALQAADYAAVVLQYNPFMYGRWGFAPWLPLQLLGLKGEHRPQIGLMVHEPYVPMVSWKWALMGAWQRAQLEAVRLGAAVVFASIETWARQLRARRPFRPALHLPVGSNLPDGRHARATMRERLKIADDEIALATFTTGVSGRVFGHAVQAANALAAKSGTAVLLHLGAGAPSPEGLANSVRVYQPGRLASEEVACWLSAADLFLAPFVDGVSTRRGSMMAALQHAVPVVGTAGPLTDGILARASEALTLVPVDRPDLFADAALKLAESRDVAKSRGRAGRALYTATFDWPVIAGRVLLALGIESAHPGAKVAQEA
jgi:glycosyltransferase involved in cell wall biosynthesis